jgi:hypothetical protein
MRKIILFISLSLLVNMTSFSQTPYHKMLGDSNRWYVSGFVLGVKPAGQQNVTDIGSPCLGYYKATKDSSYNGKVYKVFTMEQPFCPFGMGFPTFDKALVREDSLMKKVFMVHPDSVNECVAMDFGMNIGDSIYMPYSPNSYVLENGYYKLDSIASKTHILGLRKHLYLSKFNAPINFLTNKKYYVEWIESIGATHFPVNIVKEDQSYDYSMPYSCKTNQYSSYVTCKYTNSVKFYQDSCALIFAQTHPGYYFFGDNCEYYGFAGHSKELSFISELELYPNPTSSNQLTLKFKSAFYKPIEISIYNTIGQKVFSEVINITTTNNEIKLHDLIVTQGFYTLHMKSEDESSSINFIRN